MTSYKYILFDLDGTLTDPGLGITNSIMYALRKFGIDVSDRTSLYKFIGPPLRESFAKYYGFSTSESETAVAYYREYYQEKGIFENRLYDGIPELLGLLKNNDKTLIVATSKPEVYAKQILEYFNIAQFFSFVAGSNIDGSRVNKNEVINHALDTLGITDKSQVIMIGDREHDILGSKIAGVHVIGVLYGYGSRDELENAGADYISDNVADIENFVLQL